jgi:hypothetical protein
MTDEGTPIVLGDHELSNVIRKLMDVTNNDDAMKKVAQMMGAQPPRVPKGQRDHSAAEYYRTLFAQPDNDATLVAFGKAFVPPVANEEPEAEPEPESLEPSDVVSGEVAPDAASSTADGLGAPAELRDSPPAEPADDEPPVSNTESRRAKDKKKK